MLERFRLNQLLSFLVPVIFLCFIMFMACEKEVEKIVTVHDTTTVTLHDTIQVAIEVITVDTINATPDSITQGGTVELTAQVTVTPLENENLTFFWTAENGILSSNQGDTVTWKAPDTAGVYSITVQVTDGEFIGMGTRMLGVGMYAPTITPYYIGEESCTCHPTTQTNWSNTAHAGAWATLQGSGHPASYCNPCHTVGYEGDPGNSGYDEAPIAMFENVQCENCHMAGSTHQSSMNKADIVIDYDAMNCGKCHEGEHHPYLEEWEESPHNFDPYSSAHGAGANSSCQGCHDGVGALYRFEGDLSTFYGGGAVATRPDTTEVPIKPVTCSVCHDPHSDTNPGQIRTVDDIPLVTANGVSPVITIGGTGKICMHCHHARRAPETQIQNGYAHFGPHANPQADMLLGASAYHGVASPTFPWAGPSHLNVANSCKTCHLDMEEYGGSGVPAVTGHKFEPTVQACQTCHGGISSFDDIMALDDFDGDGTIEGVQSEVEGLMHLLEDALIADGLDTTGVGFSGALGDTTLSTYKQREAGYNLIFLEDDKSMGVHNPDYAIQLLQQSIQYLTSALPPNAVVLTDGKKAVAPF